MVGVVECEYEEIKMKVKCFHCQTAHEGNEAFFR